MEPSAHHAILKIGRTFEFCDAAGVSDPEAEVTASPGDLLSGSDQARSDTGNGSLAGPVSGRHVKVDAAGEIEASLDRGRDQSFELNADHSLCRRDADA